MFHILLFIFLLTAPALSWASIYCGVATSDITPPIGTPSAGYEKRKGAPMEGVLDPLLASAMVLDNGSQKIVFCSVDHLGMPYSLIEKVKEKVKEQAPTLKEASFFIGSSHTHSGGGAFCDIPGFGQVLAGPYNPQIAQSYIDGIVVAITAASKKMQPALLGIGYSKVEGITTFRSSWPVNCKLENDLSVIKVTRPDSTPIAVLFSFALHPTVLSSENRLFSADFVGATRTELGRDITCLYFNGAQAEIIPSATSTCESIGKTLAALVRDVWKQTKTSDTLDIVVKTHKYSFTPQPTPFGITVPLKSYHTEASIITLNKEHIFVTIPGELSCLYNSALKAKTKKQLTILGLVNDAHGYILLPEAWHAKTPESGLSFGGPTYGQELTSTLLEYIQQQSTLKE